MKTIFLTLLFFTTSVFSAGFQNQFFKNEPIIDNIFSQEQLKTSFETCYYLFPNNDFNSLLKNKILISNHYLEMTNKNSKQLCSNYFAVLYFKEAKMPFIVVEKLNSQMIAYAKGVQRTDNFFSDTRLKREERANLEDFKGSGYDRGHMSPAANAPDSVSMEQTFALSNIVMQNSIHNRKIWSKLESDVRKYVSRAHGDTYVYTLAFFNLKGENNIVKKVGKGQIFVPNYLAKVVFNEKENKKFAWILKNEENVVLDKPMDYNQFKLLTGIDLNIDKK